MPPRDPRHAARGRERNSMDAIYGHNLMLLPVLLVIAAIVPVVFRRAMIAGVVVEICLGALVGPHVLGLAEVGPVGAFMANFGLALLFLAAGFEMDPATMKGRTLTLAVGSWAASAGLALGATLLLAAAGLIEAPALTAIAIATTAVGVLMPILRDSRLLKSKYGEHVLAAGAIGEAGPLIALSLVMAQHAGAQSLILLAFGVGTLVVIVLAIRLQRTAFPRLVAETMHKSGQLPMRIALCVMMMFVVAAQSLEVDLVLGAFAAGVVMRFAIDPAHREAIAMRMDGIGPAFAVPIFFIISGMRLDIGALVADWRNLAMVPVFAVLMLLVRGGPVLLLYRGALDPRETRALALHLAVQISLVVATTQVAVSHGLMPGGQGAALVGAGMLTTLVFPVLAEIALRRRG
jgi:Kef-type K+ transport system membrane component KefB